MGTPSPPPLWDLPPPPPPPWLDQPLTSCAEDGGCRDIPTVSTLTPDGLPSIFHSVTVVLVSSITLVISIILLAAFFCRHRDKRQKLGLVGGEEEYKQRSSPNQYMGEGRVTRGGATLVPNPQKGWPSVTLSCPHTTMTIFPSPCSHNAPSNSSPIYETIDESFASEPVYESGSIYNYEGGEVTIGVGGRLVIPGPPQTASANGCPRPLKTSRSEAQGRPQSSIPRLVTVRTDGWEEVEGWQRFARHSFRSSDFL